MKQELCKTDRTEINRLLETIAADLETKHDVYIQTEPSFKAIKAIVTQPRHPQGQDHDIRVKTWQELEMMKDFAYSKLSVHKGQEAYEKIQAEQIRRVLEVTGQTDNN